jgi:hypothetical protein
LRFHPVFVATSSPSTGSPAGFGHQDPKGGRSGDPHDAPGHGGSGH